MEELADGAEHDLGIRDVHSVSQRREDLQPRPGNDHPEKVRHAVQHRHAQPVSGAYPAQQRQTKEKQKLQHGYAHPQRNEKAEPGDGGCHHPAGKQNAGNHAENALNHLGAEPAAPGDGEGVNGKAEPGDVQVAQQQLHQNKGIAKLQQHSDLEEI